MKRQDVGDCATAVVLVDTSGGGSRTIWIRSSKKQDRRSTAPNQHAPIPDVRGKGTHHTPLVGFIVLRIPSACHVEELPFHWQHSLGCIKLRHRRAHVHAAQQRVRKTRVQQNVQRQRKGRRKELRQRKGGRPCRLRQGGEDWGKVAVHPSIGNSGSTGSARRKTMGMKHTADYSRRKPNQEGGY